MERALPCALLLLFLLGGTAGGSGGETCRLGPYVAPLPGDPLQCPGRLDVSGGSPSDGPQGSRDSPGKARAGDPPAQETGRTWPPISGASAEEVSRSPTGPKGAGIFLMEGEQCHRWVPGQVDPVETFQCPTLRNHPKDWFCCGTCTASYCCSSLKDRLELARCSEVMEDHGAGESTGPSDHMFDPGIFLMKGEQCQKWVHGQASPVETFKCPTQPNHVEDWFCCGTCTASYCCSSRKDRLDLARCSEIMEEAEDHGAGESTGPPLEKPNAGIFVMEGEQCQKWVHGQASPVETFQCPTQDNNQEDLFCCGTCTASYCCSSLTDRLVQASCPEVMEEAEDQGAGESTGPSVEMLARISIIELVLIATGLVCICIGISYILRHVRDWIIVHNERRAGNGQQDVVREFRARPAVGHPPNRDPPPLVAEESARISELPPNEASPPLDSRSPMVEMTISPAFLPEGNLEFPPEEEDTAC